MTSPYQHVKKPSHLWNKNGLSMEVKSVFLYSAVSSQSDGYPRLMRPPNKTPAFAKKWAVWSKPTWDQLLR